MWPSFSYIAAANHGRTEETPLPETPDRVLEIWLCGPFQLAEVTEADAEVTEADAQLTADSEVNAKKIHYPAICHFNSRQVDIDGFVIIPAIT